MKFRVNPDNGYLHTVEVTVHPETKKKIKRILYWSFMGSCGAVIAAAKLSEHKNDQPTEVTE